MFEKEQRKKENRNTVWSRRILELLEHVVRDKESQAMSSGTGTANDRKPRVPCRAVQGGRRRQKPPNLCKRRTVWSESCLGSWLRSDYGAWILIGKKQETREDIGVYPLHHRWSASAKLILGWLPLPKRSVNDEDRNYVYIQPLIPVEFDFIYHARIYLKLWLLN